MKKILFLIITASLFSCDGGFKNENGISFNSDALKGKYKLDISEIVSEAMTRTESHIVKTIGALGANSISAEINFYGNGKGVAHADFGWMGLLMGEKNITNEFEYFLKDDSILVFQNKELTVRKFSDSFDFIELINKEDNKCYRFMKIAE